MDFLRIPKNANADLGEQILKRYDTANGRMQMWLNTLQQAYQLVMPNKAKFNITHQVPGQNSYMSHVYDWTAVTGAEAYASNLIQNLMPSGKEWFRFKVGRKYKGQAQDAGKGVKDLLQHMSDTVFDVLNSSNFYQALHQSMMEMSISTGVLLVNETGDVDAPITFTSVPLHECCFEEGPGHTIQNVFHTFEMPGEAMVAQWPKAKFSADVLKQVAEETDAKFTVMQSVIKHDDQPQDKQWCYTVMLKETKEVVLVEYRSYSPFITFRPMVYSGEMLGRGVMLNMISAIRTLNRLAEDELRLNAYMAKPIFMSPTGSGAINPYMARLEPGCIIPYQSDAGSNRPPIEQLQIQGNLQYTQISAQQIKADLIRALGVNPVTPEGDARETATKTQMLDEEWRKRNQEMFGRLTPELCSPVIKKVFHILHRQGYWKLPVVDNKVIDIEFQSPVMDTAKNERVSKMVSYAQVLQQTVGPQDALTAFSYGIDITKFPSWLSEQMNIDSPIRRTALSQNDMLKAAHQAAQMQGQQPQQPGQPQPPTTPGATNGTPAQGLSQQQPPTAAGAPGGM